MTVMLLGQAVWAGMLFLHSLSIQVECSLQSLQMPQQTNAAFTFICVTCHVTLLLTTT